MTCDPFDDDHESAAERAERARLETEPGVIGWIVLLLLGIAAAAYLSLYGEHTQTVMAGLCASCGGLRNKKCEHCSEGAAWLADALELQQADREDRSAYMDGWRWGALCGAIAVCLLVLLAIASGAVARWLY